MFVRSLLCHSWDCRKNVSRGNHITAPVILILDPAITYSTHLKFVRAREPVPIIIYFLLPYGLMVERAK